ncbi:O-antigen ligase family protein [Halomonas sp. MA07-2]|uniref:O-antigen ligase family protein n=1 Tax=Halomonas sp. MA07-2 TaxID=3440841 RepID=UPI003EEF4209
MVIYTNLAVALFGATVLMMATAHVALLLAAAAGGFLLVRRWPSLFYQLDDLILLFSLSFFGLAFMGMGALHGDLDAMVNLVWPILLVLPIMALLLSRPPRLKWLWGGVAFGALLSGGWAVWQTILVGQAHANGPQGVDSIVFGNLSLLLCLMSLAGLSWSTQAYRRRTWFVLLSASALSGLLASLLSGSRGGLLVVPFALLVLYRGYRADLSRGWWVTLVSSLIVLIGAFHLVTHTDQILPGGDILSLQGDASPDVMSYMNDGERLALNNRRVDIWHMAGQMILEQPVQGFGDRGYQEMLRSRIEQGALDSESSLFFPHVNNDVLEAWAKRGLPGVVALLLLYLAPILLFFPSLSEFDPSRRSLAMAGVLLSIAYMGFGVSYSFMTYPLAITFYMFWLIVLWTALRCRPVCPRRASTNSKFRTETL